MIELRSIQTKIGFSVYRRGGMVWLQYKSINYWRSNTEDPKFERAFAKPTLDNLRDSS